MNRHALNLTSRGLLKKIGNRKTSREYRHRETIFRQGDAADAMYYIQDGNVKLSVASRQGKKAVIAILRQGDFFGERCLMRRSLRMSTATAIHQSTIARVRTATMVRILHQDPAFAKLVIFYLLSRIGRIEEDFVDQFFNSSEKRLARILVLLARFGKNSEPKSAVLKLSQETLAEMVGTTRSRVSYFMNRFRKKGHAHLQEEPQSSGGILGRGSPILEQLARGEYSSTSAAT
jgi:CRP/FNR family cyclic AMP-dependent transcriptional regulator